MLKLGEKIINELEGGSGDFNQVEYDVRKR